MRVNLREVVSINKLQHLWREWLKEYSVMCDSREIDSAELAAPFFSVATPGRRWPTMLYVGKATGGCWFRDSFLNCAGQAPGCRVSERIELTERWLKAVRSGNSRDYRSDFWDFGNQLEELAAEVAGQKSQPFRHLIWSNIAKIGRRDRNPHGAYFRLQKALAIRTLRAEVEAYRPSLVYFATGDDYSQVIGEILGDLQEASWDRTDAQRGIWWRKAMRDFSPVVWTEHPQGKPRRNWIFWLGKVRELLTRQKERIKP